MLSISGSARPADGKRIAWRDLLKLQREQRSLGTWGGASILLRKHDRKHTCRLFWVRLGLRAEFHGFVERPRRDPILFCLS